MKEASIMARGIAILFLAGLILVVAGCIGPKIEEVKTHTAETPRPTPTTAQKGSLDNPASIGETVVVNVYGNKYEITVLDAIRGEEAYNEIKKAYKYYSPEPKEGFEYLLVKVRFAYAEGEGTEYVSSYNFKAYAEGVGYSEALIRMPMDKPEFTTANLIRGGKVEGWIPFEVPKGKEVLIAYEYLTEPICFIRVEAPTAETPKQTPTSTAETPQNIIKLKIGETAKFPSREVTVLSTKDGQWIEVEVKNTGDNIITVSANEFRVESSEGEIYTVSPYTWEVGNAFPSMVSLYPGEKKGGYLLFVVTDGKLMKAKYSFVHGGKTYTAIWDLE